jgi:penicillin V acylase-like amidase (Ntn superfamily)
MCTRILYVGEDNIVVTGRNMDWATPLLTDIWAFPVGMERDGGLGEGSCKWTSQYGSVIASALNGSSTDGINTQGLVVNLLFLAESKYGDEEQPRPKMALAAWAQYVLDSFATVAEAVAELGKEKFYIIAPLIPGPEPKQKANLHLSISDASGDSAIFEYKDGKLVIHHDREYVVMTNSPFYDKQLAINEYWEQGDGMIALPGTNKAADRFARASFYLSKVSKVADRRTAIATTFSIIRNASVPVGIGNPEKPNLSSTIWSTVSDHKNLVYYFANALSASLCWFNLKELNLQKGSGVRKQTLESNPELGGDLTGELEPSEPFEWLVD